MSITTQRETYTCERSPCQRTFTESEAFGRGAYCSADCLYRDKGVGLVEKIASDPDLCATCFRPNVHGPVGLDKLHASCRGAANGRTAGPLCAACEVRYERYGKLYEAPKGRQAVRAEDTDQHHRPVYRYARGCQCGTTDPSETHRFLQTEAKFVEARRNALYRALYRLADKGAIDGYPDWPTLHAAFRERPTDWAYQAGRSVYDDA